MDDKTLAALHKSIDKWDGHAAAVEAPSHSLIASDNCPLCKLHLNWNSCTGCPIQQATNAHGCNGTPWHKASWMLGYWRAYSTPENAANFRAAAAEMAAFLRSLLPTTEVLPQ